MTTQTIAEYYCERCGSAVEVDVGRARRGSKPGGGILTKLLGGGSSDGTYELTVGGTYMLCFGCRQYVCAHCWNEAEARCRTCTPAGDGCDVLPAPPPFAVPVAEMVEEEEASPPGPWPESDLRRRRGAEPEPAEAEPEPVVVDAEAVEVIEAEAAEAEAPEPEVLEAEPPEPEVLEAEALEREPAEPEALEPVTGELVALEPQAGIFEPAASDFAAPGETEEIALAEVPTLTDAAEPVTIGGAVELPAAAAHQPRVRRSLGIRPKRVVRRARTGQPPITTPETVAAALTIPVFVEPVAVPELLEPVAEPALPSAPEPEVEAEPELQIVAPETVEESVPAEEPRAKPSRRRGSRTARPPEIGSTPPAEELGAVHEVPAGPEIPGAAEPPSAPEPLPAPVVTAPEATPALPGGWRLVAGESAPPQPPAPPATPADAAAGRPAPEWPPAPPTTPHSTGLPLGVVQRIAAEGQHRIAAAWAPRMASQNHRAPQIHGCVNCALPLSATARFCRRCGSLQG